MNPMILRLLILEDVSNDAELEIAALEEAGYRCDWKRVETQDDFLAALDSGEFDLVLSDYSLPSFDGLTALKLLLERGLELPFILVSGTLGEDAAINSLKAGATDYVMKTRLSRLGPVVQRALDEQEIRLQRQRADEALRESEQLYRQVLENSMDAILVTRPDGSILSANAAATQIFQMTEKEICDAGRSGLVDPADPRLPHMLRERAENKKMAGELTMLRKGGVKFEAEITSSMFTNRHGEDVTSMIIRDVTERKRAEAIERKRTNELEQFNKMATGRELRMMELKQEINALCRELGRTEPYDA